MKIKICGLTRPKDVLNCEKYGADMMGFINIERSERYQTIGEIKKLLSIIKNKERAVLVIEPEDIEEVIMKMKKTGIRTVQLHSLDYNAIKYLRWIESYSRTCFEGNMTIIRVIGLSDNFIESKDHDEIKFSAAKESEIQNFARICDALLFDYQIKGKSGGTGKQIPLKIALKALEIAKNADKNIEIFLAGGIDIKRMENDRQILDKVFDYIDVNSGVEDHPGIKNTDKMAEIMNIKA